MDNNVFLLRQDQHRTTSLTLVQTLEELDELHLHVLRAQWGIGREAASDKVVADELGLRVEQVWQMQDSALAHLGYVWLTSVARADISGLQRSFGLSGDLGEAA
jgi:DNA-directed RNA polymerase sigma subunit (sigma70/sigma32)